MDDTGDPTQNGQTDVDQEVGIASALQEDTQGRQDEGKYELADVTEKTGQSEVLKMGARLRHWVVVPVDGISRMPRNTDGLDERKRHLRGSERHDCGSGCERLSEGGIGNGGRGVVGWKLECGGEKRGESHFKKAKGRQELLASLAHCVITSCSAFCGVAPIAGL